MVTATDFNEPSARGLGRRMAYVKGLMVTVKAANLLDSDLAEWTTVAAPMDTDFASGGIIGDRLTVTLQPAVAMAKAGGSEVVVGAGAADNPKVKGGEQKWALCWSLLLTMTTRTKQS